MGHLGKIGMPKIPEHRRNQFAAAPHEYLVLTAGIGVGAGKGGKEKHWTARIEILGYVDLTDGRKSDQKGTLEWVVTDAEAGERSYLRALETLHIYRVRAYPAQKTGEARMDTPARLAGLYLDEILSDAEQDAYLQGLLDAYNTVEKLHSETLGDLTLDRDMECYNGNAAWCGTEIEVSLLAEDPDEDYEAGLAMLEAFFASAEKWDPVLRRYAAEEMTELANEWAQEDEDEITEETFAERLEAESLVFEPDGTFTFYFGDGDMFDGHSVTVYGNMDEGPTEAEMEG